MSQIYAIKSLSTWSDYKLCCFVLIFSTCQLAYTKSNIAEPRCLCNSTVTGSSLNATGKVCKCLQESRNCTNRYKLVNNTCVKCLCNATDCNYTGNYSSSGQLLNCYKPCPAGFKKTMGNPCVIDNNTNLMVQGVQLSTDSTIAISKSSVSMLNNITSAIPSPTKRMRLPSVTILLPSRKLLSTAAPFSRKSTQLTIMSSSTISQNAPSSTNISFYVNTASNTIQSQTSTDLNSQSSIIINSLSHNIMSPILSSAYINSPSNTIEIPSTTIKSVPTTNISTTTTLISPSTSIMPTTINSLSYNSKVSSRTVKTKPATDISPLSTETPSALPTMVPPITDKPTKKSTTKLESTTDHERTTKPSSELPTTRHSHSTKKSPDEKDRGSDVVVIVLVCLGVVVILGIAITVGCWYLRAKRKQSTPFWTVELSDTRNEDFALLDPVTDIPQKPNKTTETDNSITEHSRYYAYI